MDGLKDCETVTHSHYDKFEEPCKFISKDFEFINYEYIKDRLTENTGFIVIGVIGKQTVGKSFILNMIANNSNDFNIDKPFETASPNDLLRNIFSKTVGCDIHVTSDRVILLDTQAILNINHLGVSMEKEKKIKVYSNDDTENEGKIKMSYSPDILTIQLIAYFMSICHALIIVDDRAINYRLLRLIDIAHRLKPWVTCNPSHLPLEESKSHPNFHDEFHDYVAQMVFVENMCHGHDISQEQITQYTECINQVLIGYRHRIDEQNALHSWMKETREKLTMRHNSHLKKKLQQQREKPHNSSNVVQLDEPKSDNGSEIDEDTQIVTATVADDEITDVPSTVQTEAFSDYDDEKLIEKRLNRSIYRPVKLVRMPLFDDQDGKLDQEIKSFQQLVFGLPRKHFCVTQSDRFTELCWLEYAIEMWQNIKNNSIFTDFFYSYSNLLISDL